MSNTKHASTQYVYNLQTEGQEITLKYQKNVYLGNLNTNEMSKLDKQIGLQEKLL